MRSCQRSHSDLVIRLDTNASPFDPMSSVLSMTSHCLPHSYPDSIPNLHAFKISGSSWYFSILNQNDLWDATPQLICHKKWIPKVLGNSSPTCRCYRGPWLIPSLPPATPHELGMGPPHVTPMRIHTQGHLCFKGLVFHTDTCFHGNMDTEYIAGSPLSFIYIFNSVFLWWYLF